MVEEPCFCWHPVKPSSPGFLAWSLYCPLSPQKGGGAWAHQSLTHLLLLKSTVQINNAATNVNVAKPSLGLHRPALCHLHTVWAPSMPNMFMG